MRVRERAVFLWGFLKDAPRIGSITPSSRRLAQAVTAEIAPGNGAIRVLEVGAGTGVITKEILRSLRHEDSLDIYELNERFAKHLRQRVVGEGRNGNVRVFQRDVFSRPPEGKYHYIVCGLPLNNFSPDRVRAVFETFFDLLIHDGRLSSYQYLLGRPVQSVFVGRAGRRRLRAVGEIVDDLLDRHEYRRIDVLGNFPPARAHHLRTRNGTPDRR